MLRGYLVLSHLMDAIFYSVQLNHHVKNNLEYESHQMPFCEGAALRSSLKKEGLNGAYNKFVTKNLEKAKTQLDQIDLVALKVELMEDVFSLIFLNHNDIQSPTHSQDESDEGHIGVEVDSLSEKLPLRLKSLGEERSGWGLHYSVVSLKSSNSKTISESYQGSSHSSSASSGSISKFGFLCDDKLLKDLISWLNDAFLDTKNAVYQEFGVKGIEATCTSEIRTSISSVKRNEIQKRLSKLSVYITEAQWRFELLSNDVANDLAKEKPKSTEKQGYVTVFYEISLIMICFLYFLVSFMVNGKRKKKRKRKSSHSILTDNNRTQSLGIYQKMLASPEALLRYSLLNQNLEQACQVIQVQNPHLFCSFTISF